MATQSGAAREKRILLVDDHPIVRTMMAQLIAKEPWMLVCGEAAAAEQALSLIDETEPDALVIDLELRGSSGLEVIKQLQERESPIPVLVLSMHAEMLYAHRVLRAGAKGYVSKEESPRQIMDALREVLTGRVYVSKEVSAQLVELAEPNLKCKAELGWALLTSSEKQIFRLIGEGLTGPRIAVRLYVTPAVVAGHRASIKEKLKLKTTAELAQLAALWVALPDDTNAPPG